MRSPKPVFVTGTGTDVGKTFVTAALLTGMGILERKAAYVKPVQTGPVPGDQDEVGRLLATYGSKPDGAGTVRVLPGRWHFQLSASPDQAAAVEGAVGPSASEVVRWIDGLLSPDEFSVVEGAGGLLVPLRGGPAPLETWRDVLTMTRWPTVVVALSGLGTLNHTTMTVESLQRSGIPVLGVILNGPRHDGNMTSLSQLLPGVPVYAFPRWEFTANHNHNSQETVAWHSVCSALAAWVMERRDSWQEREQARTARILARDRDHVWHPYTQHQTAAVPLTVTGARGAWLELADGRQVIDGTSSWWVNNIGHGRRSIAEAMVDQQQILDHTIFAGVTHEAACELAATLVGLTECQLHRVFYSDNGSTAVEVALKMAYQHFVNRGESGRRRFLALRGSYHGDTFGAMSVGAASGFFEPYRPFLFDVTWIDPVTHHPSVPCPQGAAAEAEALATLRDLLAREGSGLAGVIVEPLVMGAGGMLMQAPTWLRAACAMVQEAGLPLIADEVFTGFGRVGTTFAWQRAGIAPDIICLAKGITGGTMPLSVTMARDSFFESFLSDSKSKALLHGHSYTANPIACRVAREAVRIMVDEDLPGAARRMEEAYHGWIARHRDRLPIAAPRALGGILAFELGGSGQATYFSDAGQRVAKAALEGGLMIRPLGNTVYLAPPLSIAPAELDLALTTLAGALAEVTA